MATLRELIAVTSQTLGDPETSVNVQAMHLRRAKLLSSSGRGVYSARMSPSDATNLVLACAHVGKAKDSPDIVARLRKAPTRSVLRLSGDVAEREEENPRMPGVMPKLPERASLGKTLDELFAEWSSTGTVKNHVTGDLLLVNFELTTTPSGWSARLNFSTPSQNFGCDLIYDQIRAERGDGWGHKEITVRVPDASLNAIARCIAAPGGFRD